MRGDKINENEKEKEGEEKNKNEKEEKEKERQKEKEKNENINKKKRVRKRRREELGSNVHYGKKRRTSGRVHNCCGRKKMKKGKKILKG